MTNSFLQLFLQLECSAYRASDRSAKQTKSFEQTCKPKSCYLLLEVHYYADFASSYLPNEICISLQK